MTLAAFAVTGATIRRRVATPVLVNCD